MANQRAIGKTVASTGGAYLGTAGAGAIGGGGAAAAAGLGPAGWTALGAMALGTYLASRGGGNFKGIANPQESLSDALESTYGLGGALQNRIAQPVKLRTRVNPATPVKMNGVPFTIGGGAQKWQDLDALKGLQLPNGFMNPAMLPRI